jgi:hypothetical protein
MRASWYPTAQPPPQQRVVGYHPTVPSLSHVKLPTFVDSSSSYTSNSAVTHHAHRDVVEVRLELAGVPCIVSDTAGLRADSSDVIELEGMRRARWAAWLGLSWVVVTWCGLYWFVTAVFQTSGVVRWGEKAPRVCFCL